MLLSVSYIQSQTLTCNDLLKFQRSKFEVVNNTLMLKKWGFNTSKSGLVEWLHYINRISTYKEYDKILKIYFDSSGANSINYSVGLEECTTLKNQFKVLGFKFLKNEEDGENINSIYVKGDIRIKFYNKPIQSGYSLDNYYPIAIYNSKLKPIKYSDQTYDKSIIENSIKNVKIKYNPSRSFVCQSEFSATITYEIDINKKINFISIDLITDDPNHCTKDKLFIMSEFENDATIDEDINKISPGIYTYKINLKKYDKN